MLNQTLRKKWYMLLLLTGIVCLFQPVSSYAYQVSEITATYKSGQIFITWKNPSATKLQYNIYRSTSKFTSSSQISDSKFLGFVRDSSAKNIRLSQDLKENVFYRIKNNDGPLKGDRGLYVVTCTDNKSYYYAVTVTDLKTGTESKSITLDKNSLSSPVNEKKVKPQPVWQDSVTWSTGDVVQRYVQFVNNQETALYPAMNSTGSYGFNFYLIKRGNASKCPLFVFYEGMMENSIVGNGLDEFEDKTITNCYILGVDDWLPIPDGNGGIGVGENTFFCCYHEDFNIYSDNNPVPAHGTVRTYPQKRYLESINWATSHFDIDTSMIYLVGVSAGGFGALLTASIIPEKIAAVYSIVEPIIIKPAGDEGNIDLPVQMWGMSTSDLLSDVDDPNTGDRLPVYTLMNMKKMAGVNKFLNVPLIFDVHGKNDPTVMWSDMLTNWYDSLQTNNYGGALYWDGRKHDGAKSDFLDMETTPDFFKYKTNLSYPAFSNCSVDDDYGNGNLNSGSDVGTVNGRLDWDDITDQKCSYSVHTFMNDLYIGGIHIPQQYSSCKADITLRRLQKFAPSVGDKINWTNYDNSGNKIQSGSLTYNGGLVTLKNITVKKSGNVVTATITNCGKAAHVSDAEQDSNVFFTRSGDGYSVNIECSVSEEGFLNLYDLLGRVVFHEKIYLSPGTNTYHVSAPGQGIYLVEVKSNSITHADKLFF